MGNGRYVYFYVMCHGPKADGDASCFIKYVLVSEVTRSLSIPWQGMTAGSLSIISARLEKADILSTGKNLSKAVPNPQP
jgi:hypothetical protein